MSAHESAEPESKLTKVVDSSVIVFAGAIMYLAWSTIGFLVWFFVLMRGMLAWIARKILAIGHGGEGPSREQLDAISHIWPNGYSRIRASLRGKVSDIPYVPPPLLQSLYETFLALLFYGGVAAMIYNSTLFSYTAIFNWLIASPTAAVTKTSPKPVTPVSNSTQRQQPKTFDEIFGLRKK